VEDDKGKGVDSPLFILLDIFLKRLRQGLDILQLPDLFQIQIIFRHVVGQKQLIKIAQ
jgi:hypothetical protein